MPPAIRTLPSGKRVAVCAERGSSIGAEGVTAPALVVGTTAGRKDVAATANVRAKRITISRRERFIGNLLKYVRLRRTAPVNKYGRSALHSDQRPVLARFVLHKVARDGASGDR